MLIEGRQLVLLLLSPIPQTEQTRASRVHIAAACFSTNIDRGGYISRKTHPHPSTQQFVHATPEMELAKGLWDWGGVMYPGAPRNSGWPAVSGQPLRCLNVIGSSYGILGA